MGKNKHKAATTVATVAAATTVTNAGTPQAATVPGILAVKQGVALRGARAAWYAVLATYNGKPVAEFLAATAATPPSVPKSGVAEKPTGWLRYFLRTQVATVTTPPAAPQA